MNIAIIYSPLCCFKTILTFCLL